MIRKWISDNWEIKYAIKNIQRKQFIRKMEKMDIRQLMAYDADLYEKRHGRHLDWNNLQAYSEKMQWEKLFDRNPQKVILADKYAVREWVRDKIGEEYLIPLLGVWNSEKEIEFDKLPKQFVLKTNCSSGDVIIVKDKSSLSNKNIRDYRAKLKYYLNMKFGYNTCELHYNEMKQKVIAEAFIESGAEDLQDYKFLCFDGKAHFCWVDIGRYHKHTRNIYDLNWVLQDWNQYSYGIYKNTIDRPDNFEKMIEIAETLAQGFSHVRVDLYNLKGKIYFGEMTFTNASGFERYDPVSADYMLGKLWNVDTSVRNV